MGWFEEQVKKRKELDAKTFEESFSSLAGIKIDNPAPWAMRISYALKACSILWIGICLFFPKEVKPLWEYAPSSIKAALAS